LLSFSSYSFISSTSSSLISFYFSSYSVSFLFLPFLLLPFLLHNLPFLSSFPSTCSLPIPSFPLLPPSSNLPSCFPSSLPIPSSPLFFLSLVLLFEHLFFLSFHFLSSYSFISLSSSFLTSLPTGPPPPSSILSLYFSSWPAQVWAHGYKRNSSGAEGHILPVASDDNGVWEVSPYLHTNCRAVCKCDDGFLALEKLNASNVSLNSVPFRTGAFLLRVAPEVLTDIQLRRQKICVPILVTILNYKCIQL
jgi:hypothetical protein